MMEKTKAIIRHRAADQMIWCPCGRTHHKNHAYLRDLAGGRVLVSRCWCGVTHWWEASGKGQRNPEFKEEEVLPSEKTRLRNLRAEQAGQPTEKPETKGREERPIVLTEKASKSPICCDHPMTEVLDGYICTKCWRSEQR